MLGSSHLNIEGRLPMTQNSRCRNAASSRFAIVFKLVLSFRALEISLGSAKQARTKARTAPGSKQWHSQLLKLPAPEMPPNLRDQCPTSQHPVHLAITHSYLDNLLQCIARISGRLCRANACPHCPTNKTIKRSDLEGDTPENAPAAQRLLVRLRLLARWLNLRLANAQMRHQSASVGRPSLVRLAFGIRFQQAGAGVHHMKIR